MLCFKKKKFTQGERGVDFGRSYGAFGGNSIRTSKYSALTFLPLNLTEQFSKAPNVYFVVLIILQFIKSISITDGVPTIMPTLLIIMAISALKDFLEDYKRWKSDKKENNRNVSRFLFRRQGKGHKKRISVECGRPIRWRMGRSRLRS